MGSLTQNLQQFLMTWQEIPEFFAGFDLVSQEDKGFPLIDFLGKVGFTSFSNIP